MTTYAKFVSDGTTFTDFYSITVKNRMSENNSSSTFEAIFPNAGGEHSSDFSVGDEVEIYSDKGTDPPTTKIFIGIIEGVEYAGTEYNEKIKISGKDYSGLLQKVVVEPEVYNNSEVSTIVTDLIDKYAPSDITRNNVDTTTTTLTHITFKNLSIFDAIKQLAELSGFIFYVDSSKDLHFEEKETTSSGETLNNTNVRSATFEDNSDEIVNEVWVYGARQLVGKRETFTGDGAGSVYTLTDKPHNTFITVDNNVQEGAIWEMAFGDPTSGTDYLVDYDLKKVIFVSGTSLGYSSIPGNGSEIIVSYDKSAPIVKYARDWPSITNYKKRSKVVIDNNIDDPNMAKDIALNTVELNKNPKKQGTLQMNNIVALTAGNTVVVNLPYHNVSSQTYSVLESVYRFTTQTLLADNVLTVKVSKKISDVVDILKQLILDIKKLQAADVDTADIISRLEPTVGSFGLRATWYVRTRSIAGSALIWGNSTYGIWGSGNWEEPFSQFGFNLGNPNAGVLGSSHLGAGSLGAFITQYSGVNV